MMTPSYHREQEKFKPLQRHECHEPDTQNPGVLAVQIKLLRSYKVIWKPNLTVAAIAQKGDAFLMVEEVIDGKAVFNQPAGHLDENESLIEAVVRETLEETGWQFTPEHIIGLYQMKILSKERTYIRVCFSGTCDNHDPERPLDNEIIQAVWMTRDQLLKESERLRSPMVIQCIDDYLADKRYSLDLLTDFGSL